MPESSLGTMAYGHSPNARLRSSADWKRAIGSFARQCAMTAATSAGWGIPSRRGATHPGPKPHCHCQHDRRGETGDGERKGLTPPKRPLAYLPTTSQAFNAIIANAVPALAI